MADVWEQTLLPAGLMLSPLTFSNESGLWELLLKLPLSRESLGEWLFLLIEINSSISLKLKRAPFWNLSLKFIWLVLRKVSNTMIDRSAWSIVLVALFLALNPETQYTVGSKRGIPESRSIRTGNLSPDSKMTVLTRKGLLICLHFPSERSIKIVCLSQSDVNNKKRSRINRLRVVIYIIAFSRL